jgi:hypothetical protein
MFETLEDSYDKSKPPLDRGVPIFTYSVNLVLSSVALIIGMTHGFSHLFSLVVWSLMFLLSLTWLVTSLRSSTPITRSDFRPRYSILLTLLLVAGTIGDLLR